MIYRLKELKGDTIAVPQLVFSKLGIAEEYNVRVALYVLATGITDPDKICADLKLRSRISAESALSFWAGAGLLERYEENAAPGEEPSAPAPMTWAGVSGFRSAESTDFEGHAAKAISNGTRKVHACMGTALYGADGAGNADYAPPYPGSYQLGIRPGHLGGRTLSLSNGLFGTARCKGRLLVRRKRRAHEKGHPAAADGISEPDRPLFPRFRPW